MINIFGKDDFYLEMQPSHNKEQIKVNRELFKFANYHGLNYIITTDSHYLRKEDRVIHKAYLNAQNGDREVDDFYATILCWDLKLGDIKAICHNSITYSGLSEKENKLLPLKCKFIRRLPKIRV